MNVTFFRVWNLQSDRYRPQINGQIKPIVKATMVGSTKTGQYFLIDFSIF